MAKAVYWNEHRSTKKSKKWFWKKFFELMNDAVFIKTMENVRKCRDINFVTTERRGNYLVSEPNHHTTKVFTEYLLETEMKKIQILMNKPIYLEISILELSKMLMYEFWYDYVKTKCGEKAKLCYMDTNNFIVYIKTNGNYKDIAEDIERRSITSSNELHRPLPKGKNRKVIR